MKTKKAPKVNDDLAQKARAYFRAKAAGKRAYAKADRLMDEIAKELEPGQSIPLGDGVKAVVIDNFRNKAIVWGHGGVRHYELEEIAR